MKKQQQAAFTMIELLVVVTMIAVITAIGVTSYVNAGQSSRNAKRKADLETIRNALVMYRSDNGCYPASLGTSIPGYLDEVPKDPKDPTYVYTYAGSGNCGTGEYTDFSITAVQEPAGSPDIEVRNP